ncbi:DUF1398 family protein [Candidatus Binatia bacterium]|jgi:uncharacterized protein YbcV (DUF1398 family)|nr:DUF1398 family protein [Candidatus Binatia bacterium]
MLTRRQQDQHRDGLVADLVAAREHGMRIRPAVGGFPYLAEAFRRAGVERLDFVVPSATTVYTTDRGEVVEQGEVLVSGTSAIAPFDERALVAALRADQEGRATFPDFVAASWRAGVLSWTVDLVARTCTYRSARGDRTYVESYPAVDIA